VKFIRLLLNCLLLAFVVGAVLVAIVFFPSVQTWMAQRELDRHPSMQATIGSLTTGVRSFEATDIKVKFNGAVLTVPLVNAELPIETAVLRRKAFIRKLVAKNWTLDLTGFAEPGKEKKEEAQPAAPAGDARESSSAPEQAQPARNVAHLLCEAMGKMRLPYEVSLDGADLEGEIIVPLPGGADPARTHVIIRGGGMAAGKEGAFTLEGSAAVMTPKFSTIAVSGRGTALIAMKTPRAFGQIKAQADLTVEGGPFPAGTTLSAGAVATLESGEETYSLGLNRGGKALAAVNIHASRASGRLGGTWKIDLGDRDVGLFAKAGSLPKFFIKATGQIDSDVAFGRVHLKGHVNGTADHLGSLGNLGALGPTLEKIGRTSFEADFDATRRGRTIQADSLDATLTAARSSVAVKLLQPFILDEETGDLKPADAARDWMGVEPRGLPLDWLPHSMGMIELAGGNVSGRIFVRAGKEGEFVLHSEEPVTANAVAVKYRDAIVGRDLDLALSMTANISELGWQIESSPLEISSGGTHLGSLRAKASQTAGTDVPVSVSGTWSADLRALAAKAVIPGASWLRGSSASGEFSARVGESTKLNGKIAVVGRDKANSISASLRLEMNYGGTFTFDAPMKIVFGKEVSELKAEGSWINDREGKRLYMKLAGGNVVLDYLRPLAAPLLTMQSGTAGSQAGRDRTAFWGGWKGRVAVSFDHLKGGGRAFDDVAGLLQVTPTSIAMEEGRGGFAGRRFTKMDGSVAFDPAAEMPYRLKAGATLEKVDIADYFPDAKPAEDEPRKERPHGTREKKQKPDDEMHSDAPIEGHFSVAGTLTGEGRNLGELLDGLKREYRLTTTALIVRMLRTEVSAAIPEEKTPVADAFGSVGSVLGKIVGADDTKGSGKNPVSPTAEAVIEFISEMTEIGFDECSVTATPVSDKVVRLSSLDLMAQGKHFAGSGQIGCETGIPLRAQPISLDLKLWVGGRAEKLLRKVELLSTEKDERDYAMLNQPLHFGGTLEHIDLTQWHDMLVKAAAKNPAAPKKEK